MHFIIQKQVGASEEDIRQLPKYQFRKISDSHKHAGEMSGSFGGIMTECGSDPPIENALSGEDAVSLLILNHILLYLNFAFFMVNVLP